MTFRARDYFHLAAHAPDTGEAYRDYMPLALIAADAARGAGTLLMKYYGKNIAVTLKPGDDSPVTAADHAANDYLVARLSRHSHVPVVSEENTLSARNTYFAIDPLDGTREFLARNGGFCVKVALIHNLSPVAGVVYCPAQGILYAAVAGGPAVKIGPDRVMHPLTTRRVMESGALKTCFNKKHADPAEYDRVRAMLKTRGVLLPARPLVRPGLPRNLRVAEGLIDVHLGSGHATGPAAGSGFVWDVAADDLILSRAGGCIVTYDGSPLDYSRPRDRLPGFIALGDKSLRTKLLPRV